MSVQVHRSFTQQSLGAVTLGDIEAPTCTVTEIEPRLPRHAEIADALRRRITAGELEVGAPLPSESRLGVEFEASRGTVRQALAALRVEGLISGGRGRMPVVADRAARQPFDSMLSFTTWAERLGHTPGQRTIELGRRPADALTASHLDIAEGDTVVHVLRLRLLDGTPTMLERSWFSEPVGALLFGVDTDANSIYASLIERGVDIHAARHTIDAVAADAVDAAHLGVAGGSPLLRERRRAVTSSGAPVEYADDRYRPDLAAFTIDNARPSTIGGPAPLKLVKETP